MEEREVEETELRLVFFSPNSYRRSSRNCWSTVPSTATTTKRLEPRSVVSSPVFLSIFSFSSLPNRSRDIDPN